MDHQENNDPVWKLLSHAGKVEPSLLFARNVVREVRLIESSRSSIWNRITRWFSARPLVAATAGCALLAITLVVLSNVPGPSGDSPGFTNSSAVPPKVEAFDPASEMASIEYLGQLMAVADPGQLNEAALADLFY